jgi:nicotinamidase-related amidase
MSIEAMKQALEVLEQINQLSIGENAIALPGEIDAAMDNLRAAIEQAAEPVAWVCEGISSDEKHSIDYQQEDIDALPVGTMLYTTPPVVPRQWVGLTDEEVNEFYWISALTVEAIEAKLKEKNGG